MIRSRSWFFNLTILFLNMPMELLGAAFKGSTDVCGGASLEDSAENIVKMSSIEYAL